MPDYFDLFISYSNKDAADRAADIERRLAAVGIRCFFDRNSIPGGSQWQNQIRAALHSSDRLLFLATPKSLPSWWNIIEFGFAWGLGRSILVLNDGVDIAGIPNPLNEWQVIEIESGIAGVIEDCQRRKEKKKVAVERLSKELNGCKASCCRCEAAMNPSVASPDLAFGAIDLTYEAIQNLRGLSRNSGVGLRSIHRLAELRDSLRDFPTLVDLCRKAIDLKSSNADLDDEFEFIETSARAVANTPGLSETCSEVANWKKAAKQKLERMAERYARLANEMQELINALDQMS